MHTRDVYYLESVSQGLLLDRPVAKYLEEWLVVHYDDGVIAVWYKELYFV